MLISHRVSTSQVVLGEIKKQLTQDKNLSQSLQEVLSLVDQLATFDLGQFLLQNKGLNGYWTAYAILYGKNKENMSPLEDWLINKAPGILATQERFGIFQKEILKRLKPNIHIASLPCGLMEDFLSLPPDCLKDINITGIDLDNDSLKFAHDIALERSILNCQLIKRDAWDLNFHESFDLITSNGLNIYEPNTEKLIDFYQEIAKALRPNGVLITSYLSHPDDKAKPPTQKNISLEDALKQKTIFQDIIQAKWQCYQTEETIRIQLKSAGFTIEEIIYDSQCLFPTVIARK